MKTFSTRSHGLIDYMLGVLLLLAPWLFNFVVDHISTWIPVALGAAVILYSMFTDYEYGFMPEISMPGHLIIDGILGLFLAFSPWIFNFEELVYLPHLLVGLVFMIISVSTAIILQNTRDRKRKPI